MSDILIIILLLVPIFWVFYCLVARYKLTDNKTSAISDSNVTLPELNKLDEVLDEHAEILKSKSNWISKELNYLDEHTPLVDLLQTKNIFKITYKDLLSCVEWKTVRLKVLLRDGFSCNKCAKTDELNHVHHNYYLKHKLPWDIDLNALITYCKDCHFDFHKNNTVKIFESVNGTLKETKNEIVLCYRCNGAGHFPHYLHVANGTCFRCHGNLFESTFFSKALGNLDINFLKNNRLVFKNSYYKMLNNISNEEF